MGNSFRCTLLRSTSKERTEWNGKKLKKIAQLEKMLNDTQPQQIPAKTVCKIKSHQRASNMGADQFTGEAAISINECIIIAYSVCFTHR